MECLQVADARHSYQRVVLENEGWVGAYNSSSWKKTRSRNVIQDPGLGGLFWIWQQIFKYIKKKIWNLASWASQKWLYCHQLTSRLRTANHLTATIGVKVEKMRKQIQIFQTVYVLWLSTPDIQKQKCLLQNGMKFTCL